MSSNDNPTPRRPVRGSRPTSSAPKKIAGRSQRPEMPEIPGPEADAPAAAPETPRPPADTPPPPAPYTPAAPPTYVIQPETDAPAPADGVLTRSRTTVVLASVLAGLLAATAFLAGFWVDDEGGWYGLGQDDAPAAANWDFDIDEPFELPDQPIAVPFVDARNAGEASTNAVLEILTVDWKSYDDHFDSVRDRMTDNFADEYADEVEDTRDRFVESRAEYQFEVAGQSVVAATEEKVTTLLFLNQYVFKGTGSDRTGPEVYQVRVVVTAVPSGDEWLVDDLEAL
jgi:hypothetical protein